MTLFGISFTHLIYITFAVSVGIVVLYGYLRYRANTIFLTNAMPKQIGRLVKNKLLSGSTCFTINYDVKLSPSSVITSICNHCPDDNIDINIRENSVTITYINNYI